MQLSSLIDEYRDCEKALHTAIRTEQIAAIREYDIRMNWLRNVIRDFFAPNADDRMMQVNFFMDSIAQASDVSPQSILFSDIRSVIERYVATPLAPDAADTRETAGAAMVHAPDRCSELVNMIERTNLRVSAFDKQFRYTYASPANGRFYNMPQDAFRGRHVAELIGDARYEKRAKAYFAKCLAGEEQCYYYYLDSEERGRQLLECRMLRQADANNDALGALIIIRDLTDGFADPLRSAEDNLV